MRTFVALSDIHFPHEDPQAIKLVEQFLRDFHPDELYLNGDIWDMPQISKYAVRRTELLRSTDIQDDLDHGIEGVARLIDAAAPRKTCLALGNHEERWETYLGSQAKAIAGLRCLDFDKLFQLQGIDWKKYGEGFWLNDRLFLYHGFNIGVNWTDKEREGAGASTITGHKHQQRVTYHRDRSRTYKNIGQGCLCKLNVPYLRTPPNWQQGFVYGYIIDNDKFRAIETEIVRGEDEIWMAPEGQIYRTALVSPGRAATKTRSKKTSAQTAADSTGRGLMYLPPVYPGMLYVDPRSSLPTSFGGPSTSPLPTKKIGRSAGRRAPSAPSSS